MRYVWGLVLLVATYGYCAFAVNRLKLRGSFALPYVFAWYALLIYFAGLAGVLFPAVVAICAGGVALFLYFCLRRDKRVLLWFSPGWMALLCVFCGYIVFLLHGQKLTDYDNFSHWAYIAKVMLENNRFPNSGDSLMMFTSYPPGSACFLYLVGTVCGSGDSVLLIGQAVLLLAGVLALYRETGAPRAAYLILLAAFGMFACFFNSSINDLPVDSLLPIYGALALCMLWEYADTPRGVLLFAAPVLCFVFLIKNSGLYFVLAAAAFYYVYLLRTYGNGKIPWKKLIPWMAAFAAAVPLIGISGVLYGRQKGLSAAESFARFSSNLVFFAAAFVVGVLALLVLLATYLRLQAPRGKKLALLSSFLLPAAAFTVWMLHVRLAFHGASSKHALSIWNFVPVFLNKTTADMVKIAGSFGKALLSPDLAVWSALIAVIAILAVVFRKKMRKSALDLVRLIVYSFVGYLAGLYGMYLFSMPTAEALFVNSFDRYFKTIILFEVYVALFYLGRHPLPDGAFERKSVLKRALTYTIAAVCSAVMLLLVGSRPFVRQDYTASDRYYLEQLVEEYHLDNGRSYLFVLREPDAGYMYFLGRYTFDSLNVYAITSDSIESFTDWNKYQYVICMRISDDDKLKIVQALGETASDPIPDVLLPFFS